MEATYQRIDRGDKQLFLVNGVMYDQHNSYKALHKAYKDLFDYALGSWDSRQSHESDDDDTWSYLYSLHEDPDPYSDSEEEEDVDEPSCSCKHCGNKPCIAHNGDIINDIYQQAWELRDIGQEPHEVRRFMRDLFVEHLKPSMGEGINKGLPTCVLAQINADCPDEDF